MIKPMLAANAEYPDVRYPVYASPKLDGVRGMVIGGVLHTRSLKTIPNPHVQALFSRAEFNGFDGELILGDPTAKDVYRVTNGACARRTGTPAVKMHVFDLCDAPGTFESRTVELARRVIATGSADIVAVEQTLIENVEQLMLYEDMRLSEGYEGVILRDPRCGYKYGRSTIREGGMLKMKRFVDSEFVLTDVEEEMENQNEATTNELGRTHRSSHKANLVGKGRAGTLVGKDVSSGAIVRVGTGMTDADKDWFWKNRKKLVGKFTGKYKYFPIGVKDLGRHPVYLGGRESWDR